MFESLYIHVPFCNGKCAYCAFYSIRPEPELRRAYLTRLAAELEAHAPECGELRSIFIGGGTPSILTPEEWAPIFETIHRAFRLSPHCEWSVEANPESLTPRLISFFASHGVTRLSIGIQAFQENLRRRIGRNGSLENLPRIVEAIRSSSISELNFDLIYNIPGQTADEWRESLQMALAYKPTHLSAYALTLEENTRLAREMEPPSDEDFIQFWEMNDEVMSAAGVRRYEISNFAIPGHECRHNLEIWKGGTYLGCGPAATSFDGTDRFTNPASVAQWLNGTPPEVDSLSHEARACEILAFGMRMVDGWDWELFRKRTQCDPLQLRGAELRRLEARGLIRLNNVGAVPTRQGLLFNDDVAMALL